MNQICSTLLLILLFSFTKFHLSAQEECGSDLLHQYKMNTDQEYASAFMERQIDIAQKMQDRSVLPEVLVIPVVVHVIHLGEAVGVGSNIPDLQIIAALNAVNERFANVNGLGVDIEIQFCLATQDPDGCPTTGIERVNGAVQPSYVTNGVDYPDGTNCGGTPDETIKAMSTWPVLDYYNIWVVHMICEGWAGYAYYPNGQLYDGTVIVDNYMAFNYTTLTHELAHGLNLAHTFNGDNGNTECPEDENCLFDGDFICDTPPHKQGDCDVTNPCTNLGTWDNSRLNYMSYCAPTNRFTQNQKERMQASMTIFPRINLLSSPGCSPSDFGTESQVNALVCAGECSGSITVSPQCPGDYTYLWTTGEETSSINSLCPGVYSVVITNEFGASAGFDFTIFEDSLFQISGDSLYTTCEGEEIQLLVNGALDYSWSPSEGLSDTTSSSPFAQPDSTTTYQVIGTSGLGCQDTIEVTVWINELPGAIIIQSDDTLYAQPPGLDYHWYLNGELIKNETDDFIVAESDGTYSVIVINEWECESESEDFFYVGLESFKKGELLILFPNPNTGDFTLTLDPSLSGDFQIEVYNDRGKLIHSEKVTSASFHNGIRIGLKNIADGNYFLKAKNNEITIDQPFVVLKNR